MHPDMLPNKQPKWTEVARVNGAITLAEMNQVFVILQQLEWDKDVVRSRIFNVDIARDEKTFHVDYTCKIEVLSSNLVG